MKLYGQVCIGLLLIMWCEEPNKPVVTRGECKVLEETMIKPSRKDTLETRRQIAVQKQLYEDRCKGK
jgi:hypothetical protein